jgi:hypothetical protein
MKTRISVELPGPIRAADRTAFAVENRRLRTRSDARSSVKADVSFLKNAEGSMTGVAAPEESCATSQVAVSE